MSITLRFEGYSDDTFGEVKHFRDDFDNCGSGKPIEYVVTAGGESLLVLGQHCPNDATGWLVGVAHYSQDDDAPIPAWPMRIERAERPYSVALVIEAPDDVTIRCLQRSAEDDA